MDVTTAEICAECGFDSRRWRVRDAAGLFAALGMWWRLATDGIEADALNRRPAPAVWSVLEYGAHIALVTAVIRHGIERLHAEDGVVLPSVTNTDASPDDPAAVLVPASIAEDLEREGSAMVAVYKACPDGGWLHTTQIAGRAVSAETALLHAAHDATHHFMDIGRGLAAIGAGPRPHSGEVLRVNASGGGVPKLPTDGGAIGHDGLDGDVQADSRNHGRPFQALCLWSIDVIDELASQGHPIGAGCAGENITVSGIDWAALRPGTRLQIGTALAEISFPAVPCAKQTGWFTDGDFKRIAHERNPQWVRWYAWVREPGHVRPGDAVVIP
jgi:MOSC domain-containing protein YiiM